MAARKLFYEGSPYKRFPSFTSKRFICLADKMKGLQKSEELPQITKGLSFSNRISPKEIIPNSKSLRAEIRDVLIECGERSSVHGFPSFASSSVAKPLKLIWLCFVLASWAYFGYQMTNSISSYLSYSVTTSSLILEETPTFFPGTLIPFFRYFLSNI